MKNSVCYLCLWIIIPVDFFASFVICKFSLYTLLTFQRVTNAILTPSWTLLTTASAKVSLYTIFCNTPQDNCLQSIHYHWTFLFVNASLGSFNSLSLWQVWAQGKLPRGNWNDSQYKVPEMEENELGLERGRSKLKVLLFIQIPSPELV